MRCCSRVTQPETVRSGTRCGRSSAAIQSTYRHASHTPAVGCGAALGRDTTRSAIARAAPAKRTCSVPVVSEALYFFEPVSSPRGNDAILAGIVTA